VKFNSLKLFIDILNVLMSDPHIYDEKKIYGKIINEFILKNILNNVKKLLKETEPIPFYALKLVNLIVDKSVILVQEFIKSKMAF
jgi:hypothetical protein